MYNKLMGYLCTNGLESFGFGLSYLHLGTVPVLFVLFLDLPSLHVSHFGTKCFYTCLCSFVLCSVCIYYIIIEGDIFGMGCIPFMNVNLLHVSGTWFV